MTADEPFNVLRQLYADHGAADYIGEAISQVEHALQAAALAADETPPAGVSRAAFVVASLLHDVGHLVAATPAYARPVQSMGGCGAGGHERIGADYLASLRLAPDVCQLVAGHVATKRYLCAVEPGFEAGLSDASRVTLGYQGGPMTDDEAAQFRLDPLLAAHLALRRCDDRAKVPNKLVPSFDCYADLIQQSLL